MDSAIWGLLGTVVGALASIATSWIASHSSHRIHQDQLKADRGERANEFQRQNLLDLQEALHDALRLVSRAHIEDLAAHRGGQERGKNMLSANLDEDIRLSQRRVSILVERVSDDQVRDRVKLLMKDAVQLLLARSERESTLFFDKTTDESPPVFELIGSTLRLHYPQP